MTPLKKVLLFGGTHGNEWTGIYALKVLDNMIKTEFKELDVKIIQANPEAFKINKRFKDEDLNRAFQFLHENRPHSYEHQRAKEIKSLIEAEPCFILDLHTTTSNMGNTVIISHPNPLNFYVASLLTKKLSDTRIILSPDPQRKYLASQSEFGLMIEVGPVANGVIKSKELAATVEIIKEVLRSLSTLTNLTEGAVEIYEEVQDVYYPQNESGEISAYIHENFQDKDFIAVEGSFTPFRSLKGEEVSLEVKEKLYPIFINEAAYYPTKLAFTLCRKKEIRF